MSKLQQALNDLDASLKTLRMYSGSMDTATYYDCKGTLNVAQAELNDHLQLYSAVHEHLRECNMYPMNIKEMLKMFEEVSGCSGVPLVCPGLTQFDTEEEYNVRR